MPSYLRARRESAVSGTETAVVAGRRSANRPWFGGLFGRFGSKPSGQKVADPGGNALLDPLELLARAFKICFGGAALQCWTIADAVELKIELDAIATEGNHATMYGFAAHRVP